MTPNELWSLFLKRSNISQNTQFKLLPLGPFAEPVNQNKKTATTSPLSIYKIIAKDNEFATNDYCIVTNETNDAICVVQIQNIEIKKFNQIDDNYAKKENFETKQQWMECHENFFTPAMQSFNMSFNKDIDVICFNFEKVFSV